MVDSNRFIDVPAKFIVFEARFKRSTEAYFVFPFNRPLEAFLGEFETLEDVQDVLDREVLDRDLFLIIRLDGSLLMVYLRESGRWMCFTA